MYDYHFPKLRINFFKHSTTNQIPAYPWWVVYCLRTTVYFCPFSVYFCPFPVYFCPFPVYFDNIKFLSPAAAK